MRPEILTHTGHYFNFLEPEKSVICVQDIAYALSNINRFNGHTNFPYSVAQHSVSVSHAVPAEDAYDALMHDAAEAYIGDIAKPLKQLLPDYQKIEAHVEEVIFRALGVCNPLPESVKHADLVLLATEQRDIMPEHDDEWTFLRGIKPLPTKIVRMSQHDALLNFIKRYKELRPNSPSIGENLNARSTN